MREAIHTMSARVRGAAGESYLARVVGERRADGTWEGWLEFLDTEGSIARLRTDRETSQPDRAALEYWATGLEPVYLEGALKRAHRLHG